MPNALSFKILEDIARDLSGGEVSFPTFLDITFQIQSALEKEDLSVEQLAKLVGADPLMGVKIIRMANSVAFNPSGREVADVRSAILRVGMEAVRTASFAVAMEQLLQSGPMQAGIFRDISGRLWEHSAHVAALCRVLAGRLTGINEDEAMFAGLVHDLGVFYLMSRAAHFSELASDRGELHALLVGWHDNIGHALLNALGQPGAVLAAVLEHENDREIQTVASLSDVLYIANKIANRTSGWRIPELSVPVDTAILDQLFDSGTLQEMIRESEGEVLSLKAALGG